MSDTRHRLLCIRCWRLTPTAELHYRCARCQDARRRPGGGWMEDPNAAPAEQGELPTLGRSSRTRFADWFGETVDGEPEGGGCPRHPEARVELFCPCGAAVEPRSQVLDDTPLGFGIAGPRSAGKTLLLLTMVHELRAANGAALDLFGVGDTDRRFHQLSSSFFDDGRKPEPTPEPADGEPGRGFADASHHTAPKSYCWQMLRSSSRDDARAERRSRGRSRPAAAEPLLAVHDIAGETWGKPSTERHDRFDRYLGLVSSLIFVIDGAMLAADLGCSTADAWDPAGARRGDGGAMDSQWLGRLIDRLGERSTAVDLALVISKADLLWQDPKWQQLRTPALEGAVDDRPAHADGDDQERLYELLERGHRRRLVSASQRFFRSVRLFATSSLGFCPVNDDVDGDRLERSPRPLGVLQPLEWLLAQRGLDITERDTAQVGRASTTGVGA